MNGADTQCSQVQAERRQRENETQCESPSLEWAKFQMDGLEARRDRITMNYKLLDHFLEKAQEPKGEFSNLQNAFDEISIHEPKLEWSDDDAAAAKEAGEHRAEDAADLGAGTGTDKVVAPGEEGAAGEPSAGILRNIWAAFGAHFGKAGLGSQRIC